jgi:hypothetical protein
MRPHDRMMSAAHQTAAEAESMRAIASLQIADDQLRRVRMRKLLDAMAAQQDRLRRRRRV